MSPVAGVLDSVTGKCNMTAVHYRNSVGSPVVFFSQGIVTVFAVYDRALFADDRNIVSIVYANNRIVPATSLCSEKSKIRVFGNAVPLGMIYLRRIYRLNSVIVQNKVVLGVSACLKNAVLKKMKCRV